jgi:hypothetical protein
MKGRRHTPEPVVRKLRDADRLLGVGQELPEVCKTLEVSESDVSLQNAALRTCGAIDFQFDQTADGHNNLKLLHVVDEFTREPLAIECRRRIDADQIVNVLDRLIAERHSTPTFVRCDNGRR